MHPALFKSLRGARDMGMRATRGRPPEGSDGCSRRVPLGAEGVDGEENPLVVMRWRVVWVVVMRHMAGVGTLAMEMGGCP